MKKKLNLITACFLIAGSVFAQQASDSIEGIMNELMNYTEETNSSESAESTPVPQKKPEAAENDIVTKPERPVDPKPEPAPENEMEATVETIVSSETEIDSGDNSNPDDWSIAEMKDMSLEELMDLKTQVDQDKTAAMNELQELADLVKNEPDSGDAMERFRAKMIELWKNEDPHRTARAENLEAVDAAWSEDLVLRSYPLVSGAAQRLKMGDTTRAVDVEMLFSLVDFPKGGSAIYQPETQTIFVTNTRKNHSVLHAMLETMGILKQDGFAEQVEIEAKFVEVSEGTLEELGFQWNFADPTTIDIGGTDLDVNDGSGGLFSDGLRGTANNAGGALPFNRPIDLGDGTIAPSGDWSTFRFADRFSTTAPYLTAANTDGTEFDLLISALDQSSGADVLSAPRILTRSGEEATIQVGELHYFPEVYEGDSAQATIVNVSYEDFEEKLLGVELTVTPKITGEHEITLELNPRIMELAGWQSYQLVPGSLDINPSPAFATYKGSHYNHRQLDTALPYEKHDPIVASLPIFKKREIQTQVTIADGSTIGMGGLISETVESFEDSVPVLGRIPVVGRLFRSEGERVVKRNLLMFVTAKIIDPHGRVDSSRSFE